jgi:hypothetical protein
MPPHALEGADHPVTPKLGTIRTRDGRVTDGLNPSAYPLTGECLECGRPATIASYLGSDWQHTEPSSVACNTKGSQ